MEKKYVFITGATGGIGSAAVRWHLKRGYNVFIQHRYTEPSKIEGLQKLYPTPNAHFVYSDLKDESTLVAFFTDCKQKNIVFSKIVLAAGTWNLDKAYPSIEDAIKILTSINASTKKSVINAFIIGYGIPAIPVPLFLVSSHVSDLSDEEAIKYKQVGYIYSMRFVNDIADWVIKEYDQYFKVYLLKTKQVETPLYTNTVVVNVKEDSGDDLDKGENADIYVDRIFTKAEA